MVICRKRAAGKPRSTSNSSWTNLLKKQASRGRVSISEKGRLNIKKPNNYDNKCDFSELAEMQRLLTQEKSTAPFSKSMSK